MAAADIVQAQQQELVKLLGEIKTAVDNVASTVPGAIAKVKDSNKGLSFLEVKNHCMMSYLTGLCALLAAKLQGKLPCESPALAHLTEMRVFLEKIRPMETKLKYRIDKLLKQNEATAIQQDALSFKPNLEAFDADGGDSSAASDAEDGETAGKSGGVYKAPKLAPVAYEDDRGAAKREARAARRMHSAAANSRLLRELAAEHGDAPEEQSAGLGDSLATESIDAHFADRAQYEEDHFVRLNLTRKEKKMQKRRERVAMTDEVHELMGDLDQRIGGAGGSDDEPAHREMVEYLDSKRSKRKRGDRAEDVALTGEIAHDASDFLAHKNKAQKRLKRQVGKDRKRARA